MFAANSSPGVTMANAHAMAALVVTCEHGGNHIPEPYGDLFAGHQALLDSHRGFDAGALVMAQALAVAFGAPLLTATVSRLLVDLNRSVGNPSLHFESVGKLSAATRQSILDQYYHPYRTRAKQLVMGAIARHGRVVHISSHSFTPELDGKVRKADVGLLYDPARPGELALCRQWQAAFRACAPELTVRRNYPYAGWEDGLTTRLRKSLSADQYIGIELELNQKYVLLDGPQWHTLCGKVIESLRTVLIPPSIAP
jgi:predicted N-formylglutamate amidohydrolase